MPGAGSGLSSKSVLMFIAVGLSRDERRKRRRERSEWQLLNFVEVGGSQNESSPLVPS